MSTYIYSIHTNLIHYSTMKYVFIINCYENCSLTICDEKIRKNIL